MNILSISEAAVALKDGFLFENLGLGIETGDKIGLVGRNGSGKTSLLRLLAGSLPADRGEIARKRGLRMAMLEQMPEFDPQDTIASFLYRGNASEIRAGSGGGSGAGRAATGHGHRIPLENRYASLCAELGLRDMDRRVATLSGGERKKAALARTLAPESDLVLLDEPTNHLDLDTIEWLESRLRAADFAFVLVTHDRWFLDSACDSILEIDRRQVFRHPGNYSEYLKRKAERWASLEAAENRRLANLKIELAWLMRGARARATKSERRKDDIRALREAALERPPERYTFNSEESRLGRKVIILRKASLSYGAREILNPLEYEIGPGARIGIVGPNGSGKTSLLDLMRGALEPTSGTVERGDTVRIACFEQTAESVSPELSVLDYIREQAENVKSGQGGTISASVLLERFGFSRDFQAQTAGSLSGGERRRLQLVRTLALAPNVLLLDEPTNDLDIETIEALEEYLDDFPGCIIAVSHDRAFLDRIAERLLTLDGSGKVTAFTGGFAEWRESLDRARIEGESARAKAAATKTAAPGRPERTKRGLSYAERRELDAILPEIDSLESEKASLESFFGSKAAPPAELRSAHLRYGEISKLIEEKLSRWETLARKEAET